jgi:hypothetical protein
VRAEDTPLGRIASAPGIPARPSVLNQADPDEAVDLGRINSTETVPNLLVSLNLIFFCDGLLRLSGRS